MFIKSKMLIQMFPFYRFAWHTRTKIVSNQQIKDLPKFNTGAFMLNFVPFVVL